MSALEAMNASSIDDIWEQNQLSVRRFLISMTRDIDLADDLLQETYIRAADSICAYRGENDKGWLMAIAKNLFFAHNRRKYVSAEINDENAISECQYSPVGNAGHIDFMAIRQAIESLKPRIRTALIMKHYFGFTYEEIARRCNYPEGTAKRYVHEAVCNLKNSLHVGEMPGVVCMKLSRTKVLDYLYGSLDKAESARVERHISECEKCRASLDSTSRLLAELDAVEGERKLIHIVELNERGEALMYSSASAKATSDAEDDSCSFCSSKGCNLEYLSIQGIEVDYTMEENTNPDYPGTNTYRYAMPCKVEPGDTLNMMAIFKPTTGVKATLGDDGCWTFEMNQMTSVDSDNLYLLVVRLPDGYEIVSSDPSPSKVNSGKHSTLIWNYMQKANEWLGCKIKYKRQNGKETI